MGMRPETTPLVKRALLPQQQRVEGLIEHSNATWSREGMGTVFVLAHTSFLQLIQCHHHCLLVSYIKVLNAVRKYETMNWENNHHLLQQPICRRTYFYFNNHFLTRQKDPSSTKTQTYFEILPTTTVIIGTYFKVYYAKV